MAKEKPKLSVDVEAVIAEGLRELMDVLPDHFNGLVSREPDVISDEAQTVLLKWFMNGAVFGMSKGASIVNDMWHKEFTSTPPNPV